MNEMHIKAITRKYAITLIQSFHMLGTTECTKAERGEI